MRCIPAVGLVYAILTLPTTSYPEVKFKTIYDVRKVLWGMTKEQVTRSETWKISKDDANSHMYKGELFGRECFVAYGYHKGVLSFVTYGFGNADRFIYENVVDHLRRKYGKPAGTIGSMTAWDIKGRTTIAAKYDSWKNFVSIGYVDARKNAKWKKSQDEQADDAF